MTFLLTIRAFLAGLPWQLWAGIAILAAMGLSYCAGEKAGQNAERAVWEAKVAEIRAKRVEAMNEATGADTETATEGKAVIEMRRKEIDDAKQDLPDQGLSDRQRVRACRELQRQGRRCPVPSAPAP